MRAQRCIEGPLAVAFGTSGRKARAAHVGTRGAALLEAVVVICTLLLLFAMAAMSYQRYEAAFFRSRAGDLQRWTNALSGCGHAEVEARALEQWVRGETSTALARGAADGLLPCNPGGAQGDIAFAANRALPLALLSD